MAARKQRGTLELRPLSIELGPLPHAQHDGSAIVSMGPVKALAAVSGPSEVRIRDEKTNSAALDVHYTPLQGMAGGTTSTSFAQAVEGIAQAVLMLHLFPRSLVTLHLNTYASPPSYTAHRLQHASQRPPTTPPAVQPPHPDAAIPAALQAAHINAVTCACLDAAASIGMRAMVAAVSAAVLRKDVRANLMHGWRAGEVAPEYSSGAAAGASDDEDEDLYVARLTCSYDDFPCNCSRMGHSRLVPFVSSLGLSLSPCQIRAHPRSLSIRREPRSKYACLCVCL